MNIAAPENYWYFISIPALLILFFYAYWRRSKIKAKFASPKMMQKLSPPLSEARVVLKAGATILVLVFLVLALIRPQWGKKVDLVKRKGLDIMLVQDISLSMMAEDIVPNRLTRAKHEISSFLEQLHGDRVGLTAFAGKAQVLCPMTLDYGAARIFLKELSPTLLKGGTDLAGALKTAMSSLPERQEKFQVIVLLTDGEEHDPQVLKIADKAAERDITIYTVGIGSIEGVPIPLGNGKYKKDRNGNIVSTRLDEATLKKIAFKTGGSYVHANSVEFGLQKVLDELKDRERRELEGKVTEQYRERFQIPLGVAILFLIIQSFLSDRRLPRKEQA